MKQLSGGRSRIVSDKTRSLKRNRCDTQLCVSFESLSLTQAARDERARAWQEQQEAAAAELVAQEIAEKQRIRDKKIVRSFSHLLRSSVDIQFRRKGRGSKPNSKVISRLCTQVWLPTEDIPRSCHRTLICKHTPVTILPDLRSRMVKCGRILFPANQCGIPNRLGELQKHPKQLPIQPMSPRKKKLLKARKSTSTFLSCSMRLALRS